MDAPEVRQMVKHKQCVVLIDTSPPIKCAYPPYAVLKQRAIACEFGEPKLVSLEDAEAEYLRETGASNEVDATAKKADGAADLEAEAPRETIDGGLNYTSEKLILDVVAIAGEPLAKESGGAVARKRKNRPGIEHRQVKLFSDQAVESELLESAEEEIKNRRLKLTVRNDQGERIETGQMVGVLNSGVEVTAQHDSLR
jgi:hypothetical protein